MGSRAFPPLICFFIIAAFASSKAQSHIECGIYEEEVECVDICKICDEDRPCPPTACVPGCDCVPGFLRNNHGNCIPRRFCNVSALRGKSEVDLSSGGCPNARFCVVSCEMRGFEDGICLGPLKEYCNCFSSVPPPKTPPKVAADAAPKPSPRHGCPETPALCSKFCKDNSYLKGECVGKKKKFCKCSGCILGVDRCPKSSEENRDTT